MNANVTCTQRNPVYAGGTILDPAPGRLRAGAPARIGLPDCRMKGFPMLSRLVLPLLLLASPGLAGTFTPPESCTATLTVQGRGCFVSNYYTCTKDAPGDQWRADFDQEGMFYLSRIDSETQWVESYDLNPKAVSYTHLTLPTNREV